MSKRHQSSRRKAYGRRQHELRERTDRHHAAEPSELTWDDMAVIEVNEAFASVVLQFLADTGLRERWEAGDVNPNGGGISLGHPLGATGARMTATLLSELERRDARYGIAAMCIGFGQAIAGVVERL